MLNKTTKRYLKKWIFSSPTFKSPKAINFITLASRRILNRNKLAQWQKQTFYW